MSGTLTTLLSFSFVLGVLVFVHELGHFLAAKRVGIKVLKFQLGFNPTIFSFRRGDTEYGIGALPLGGYVKMAGDNPDEARSGAPDEFLSKTKWQRFQVLIMGPVMNLALAVILLAVVFYSHGVDQPAYFVKPVVVAALKTDGPAARAGIQPGDHIVSVGGRSTPTWEDFELTVGTRANRESAIQFERGGESLTRTVTPVNVSGDSRFDIGDIGVLPDTHPFIQAVQPDTPAEHAGLQVGDVIASIDGQTIADHLGLTDYVSQKHPGALVSVAILRHNLPQNVSVKLAEHPQKAGAGYLGVTPADEMMQIKPGVVGAAKLSVVKNVQIAGMIIETVRGLFTREVSPKQLMGPVAIAQASGETAKLGLIALFAFMAQVSLNLGLLNLMPIPILDGGHIFIMALEGVARRDFSTQLKEKMLLAGFVVLMMLMVTVIYNDLTRVSWIERLMPWR